MSKGRYVAAIFALVAAMAMIIVFFTMIMGNDDETLEEIVSPVETEVAETSEADIIDNGDDGIIEATPVPNSNLEYEPTYAYNFGDGLYDNTNIVSYQYSEYGILYAGIQSSELKDAIYLNFHSSEADIGYNIGYYISASSGELQYSRDNIDDCDSDANKDTNDLAIMGRLFTECRDITFYDADDYGVRWVDIALNQDLTSDATITVRAVNMDLNIFLGVFDFHIEMTDDGGYYLRDVTSAEVSTTGELTDEVKSEIVEATIDFIQNKLQLDGTDWENEEIIDSEYEEEIDEDEDYEYEESYYDQFIHVDISEWKDAAREQAFVDKVTTPYFSKVLDTTGKTIKTFVSSSLSTCKDIFAVTVPYQSYGYVTVYYAPFVQVLSSVGDEIVEYQVDTSGLTDVQIEWQTLRAICYDAVNTRDANTLLTPTDGTWAEYDS